MNQTKKNAANTNEHFDALGELLAQLKTHLTESAGKQGTYGDYLRLLEFYREARGEQAMEIVVRWVDSEDVLT